ncbi:PASTA domain protein [Rhodococcus erythropolis]|nr:PASTA domain protein [Rhodococcus erythropolis]
MLYISKTKIVIALSISVILLLGAILCAFTPEPDYGAALGYFALTLIPILYLSVARRRAIKRILATTGDGAAQTDGTGVDPATAPPLSPGRSWLPVGIPLVIAFLIAAGVLSEAVTPDPNAIVPSVVGMRLDDAKKELKSIALKVETIDSSGDDRKVFAAGNWTVTDQNIAANTQVGQNKTITLGVLKHDEIGAEPAAASTADSTLPAIASTAVPSSPIPTTTTTPVPSAPERSTTVAAPPAVPTHDACNLIDIEVLKAAGFVTRTDSFTDIPTPGGRFTDPEEIGTWACANAELDLALEVTLFTTPERARSAAEYNTSADQNFLTDGGIRTPFDASMGGAKIINTELGVSRTTWSRGPYAMLLEVNFIGEIKGLPDYGMPAWKVERVIDETVTSAEFGLVNVW